VSEKNCTVSRSLMYVGRVLLFCMAMTLTAFILYALFRSFYGKSDSVSADAPEQAPKTVIIDAGHGGMDGGAVSVTGSLEKDLNLDLAETLKCMLEAAGYNVVMTRTDDSMLNSDGTYPKSRKMRDLQARLEITESHPDAILVSIHMNKFPEEKYSGLQVYYSGNNSKSKEIAQNVQEMNKLVLQPNNSREIKAAGDNIYLLKNIKIPAILVECGFLSNTEEAKLLDTEIYRKKIACLIFAAIQPF